MVGGDDSPRRGRKSVFPAPDGFSEFNGARRSVTKPRGDEMATTATPLMCPQGHGPGVAGSRFCTICGVPLVDGVAPGQATPAVPAAAAAPPADVAMPEPQWQPVTAPPAQSMPAPPAQPMPAAPVAASVPGATVQAV